MRGKRVRVGLVIAVMLVLLVSLPLAISCGEEAPPPPPDEEEEEEPTWPEAMNVVQITAMTGAGSFYGLHQSRGAILAIEEINASGELPFELNHIILDHKSGDMTAGVAATRKAIDVYNCPWILSSWGNVVLGTQPICAENQVVIWNGGGQDPSFIGQPFLHNNIPMCDQQVVPLIEYFYNDLGIRRLAISNNVYPDAIREGDAAYWTADRLGMVITGQMSYEADCTDYRSGIAKIKLGNPEAMYNGHWWAGPGYIAKQCVEAGLDIIQGHCCGFMMDSFPVGGEAFDGTLACIQDFSLEPDLPWAKAFVENYIAKWPDDEPTSESANYYEQVYILKDCILYIIANGGDPFDGEQLDAAITEIREFRSLSGEGTMEMLPDGSVKKQVTIYEASFETGHYEPIRTFWPPESQLLPHRP